MNPGDSEMEDEMVAAPTEIPVPDEAIEEMLAVADELEEAAKRLRMRAHEAKHQKVRIYFTGAADLAADLSKKLRNNNGDS